LERPDKQTKSNPDRIRIREGGVESFGEHPDNSWRCEYDGMEYGEVAFSELNRIIINIGKPSRKTWSRIA
jgi:hypothetical protein